MAYLSPMPVENEQKILDVVTKLNKVIPKFRVKLEGFVKGTNGYIFVALDEKSQNKLKEIRNQLIDSLLPYRDSTIKQKYLDKWERFSEEEKDRIKTTGLPYEYEAHLTLAQVPEGKEEEVIEILQGNSLNGQNFEAIKLQVLTSNNGVNKMLDIPSSRN